jgi:stage II sporulation protein D
VVPGEIGGLRKEWIEAGRAQAIAARSYTLFYRGRRGGEGFDLFGTVEDQVYGSIESERALATGCVNDTRGRVATYEGQPIRANYCSTCGGISAEVWEAWPAAGLPYLESRRDGEAGADHCASSAQYRWRERWSAEEFIGNLERYGPAQGLTLPPGGLGELVDVQVAARSRSGRVWRLLVRTGSGELTLPSYAIRGALRRGGNPSAILRSSLFKIDVRRDPATGRALEVVASGAGAGHGVGLCQTGALGMARDGADAGGILSHYYPGASLERLY